MFCRYKESLKENKSRLLLLMTLFLAFAVACMMFINKKAFAEESNNIIILPGASGAPLSVYPEEKSQDIQTLKNDGRIGQTEKTQFFTKINTDGNYLIEFWDYTYDHSFTYEYKYIGSEKLYCWDVYGNSDVEIDFRKIKPNGFVSEVFDIPKCGNFPATICAYIGANHYFESTVEGGSMSLDDTESSNNTGTFDAVYGVYTNDLSMSYDSQENKLTYDTGYEPRYIGDKVTFTITPDKDYVLEKIELWDVKNNTLIVSVTPDNPATNINEVQDKIVPVFKKKDSISVSGSATGNMCEPFYGAEVWDITDSSNSKKVTTTDINGYFNFSSVKNETRSYVIKDPKNPSLQKAFDITAEEATKDINVGNFYLVNGAETNIDTSGTGFNGIQLTAKKDGTTYYDGPYGNPKTVLPQGGQLYVNESDNLIYEYTCTDDFSDDNTSHEYELSFKPNVVDGYCNDNWTINGTTIEYGDDPFIVTEDDVSTGLDIVPSFKLIEYITVSGKVTGNMLEPLCDIYIWDVTISSDIKLATTTDEYGNFEFYTIKNKAHKFLIRDPFDVLTSEGFEITKKQAVEDINVGHFYMLNGAQTYITTSGTGFDGVQLIAIKDGTTYYDGPYIESSIVLSLDGNLSVNENGNLIYSYTYTDDYSNDNITHEYELAFKPNVFDGYCNDNWKINNTTIKHGDDPFQITEDEVASGLNIVPSFKLTGYIKVSGNVMGNMQEPLADVEVWDITDSSKWEKVAITDAGGNFNFSSIKNKACKFLIKDPFGYLTSEGFEITKEQATDDIDVGRFYMVNGAKTNIITSGIGFDGVQILAKKDGITYYDGPYEEAKLVLCQDGQIVVNEEGNLVYKYSYIDEAFNINALREYELTFRPNVLVGYHVDRWEINSKIIKFKDEAYLITSDDVEKGLLFESVMAANPIDPDVPVVEGNTTAQTGDYIVMIVAALIFVLALTGACTLRFRNRNKNSV